MFTLHNRTIPYAALDKAIPRRDMFVDREQRELVDQIMARGDKLLFLPTHLKEVHLQDARYEKAKYKIALSGITQDGRKLNVVLDEIYPYFEVKIPFVSASGKIERDGHPPVTPYEYVSEIKQLLKRSSGDSKSANLEPDNESLIKGKPFKYYQDEQNNFLRLYYLKTKLRAKAIRLLREHNYETAHDDLSCYYRVVCRDYLTTFSSWVELNSYESCNISVLKGACCRLDIADYKKYQGDLPDYLMRDKTMSMAWDIETWSAEGNLPEPSNPKDCVFCIGLTFQWVHDEEPFLKVALVDYPSAARDEYLTVVCQTETKIFKAFALLIEKLSPEFIIGFNDSDYDWPWIIERAGQTKGLLSYMADRIDNSIPGEWNPRTDRGVMQFNYKKEHVKIEAETYVDGYALMLDGYIPVDVRTVFRGLYPTAEKSSLNWFLQKQNLANKEDMPYKEMFRIYGEMRALNEQWCEAYTANLIDFEFADDTPDEVLVRYEKLKSSMADINKYCVVDSQRCHDLMKARAVFMDQREIGNLSYCSVYDAFYRADGMKVRNLTISIGQDPTLPFGLRFTNISNEYAENDKYPGAYVFPPKKGLSVSKLSIAERKEKAHVLLQQGKNDHVLTQWLTIDEQRVQQIRDIIKEHGAVLTRETIVEIEQSLNTRLEKCVKEFLMENIGRPITGLDFSSLYPSLIMTYNFSPEYCILEKSRAREYNKEHPDHKLTRVEFDFNTRTRRAWFIGHNNKLNPASKEDGGDGEEFQFGLYPYILRDLFLKRKSIKKTMSAYMHEMEQMKADGSAYQKENANHFADITFKYNYYNSKQLALKVFMNTFYGESGNKLSPFFVLELAGGITSYGQKNIKMAQARVESHGCEVHYGDTDSIYLSIPKKYFSTVDKQYYAGDMTKREYWTKLVEITFEQIKGLRDDVNEMFVADNGTHFLNMAYEEALYPVIFMAKKKYFGIPHENLVNFDIKSIKDLFIRGLEIKKRGASQLLIKSFGSIMMDCCSLNNTSTILELVLNRIDSIYTTKWDLSDFLKSACYRPNKHNVSVKTFHDRVVAQGKPFPVNERFNYVVIKKYPYAYDQRGRKIELKVGDKMEFPETVVEQGLEIDLDYYMKGQVNGQLARLLVYHQMFHVDPVDNTTESIKSADEQVYKHACKYIDEYCKQYYSTYHAFGEVYQKIFRTAQKALSATLSKDDPLGSDLLCSNVNLEQFETWFVEMIRKKAQRDARGYGKQYIDHIIGHLKGKEKTRKITLLQKAYYGVPRFCIKDQRNDQHQRQMSMLRRQIREKYSDIAQLYQLHGKNIDVIRELIKENVHISDELFAPRSAANENAVNDIDVSYDERKLNLQTLQIAEQLRDNTRYLEVMEEYKKLYYAVYGSMLSKYCTESVLDELKQHKDNIGKQVSRPREEQLTRSLTDDDHAALMSMNI